MNLYALQSLYVAPFVVVELPFFQESVVVRLSERLVQRDGDGVTQIEGTRLGEHGNAQTGPLVLHQQLLGQPLRLLAEHEKIPVAKLHVAVTVPPLGREIEESAVGIFGFKFVKAVVIGDLDEVPVIQSRAF